MTQTIPQYTRYELRGLDDDNTVAPPPRQAVQAPVPEPTLPANEEVDTTFHEYAPTSLQHLHSTCA